MDTMNTLNFDLHLLFYGNTLYSIEFSIGMPDVKNLLTFRLEHPLLGALRHYFENLDEKDVRDLQRTNATSEPLEILEIKEFEEVKTPEPIEDPDISIVPNNGLLPDLDSLVQEIKNGLELHSPELIEEGTNGTYFLFNAEGDRIAIFKPDDEEGSSPSNPKARNEEEENDKGILPNEASLREVAAYMLDKNHFYGVPETTLVKMNSKFFSSTKAGSSTYKIGSLQRFVENDGSAFDIGPSVFPTNEVHKIGILDLQILNSDRHEGNILWKENEKGSYDLIPIDHSYSLPHSLGKAWFDWMNWPQAKRPFNAQMLDHIASLDIEENTKLLRALNIHEESIRYMRYSTTLLKIGASKGLTLYDIASMVSRKDLSEPSDLERMFLEANQETSKYEELEQILFRRMEEAIDRRKSPPSAP